MKSDRRAESIAPNIDKVWGICLQFQSPSSTFCRFWSRFRARHSRHVAIVVDWKQNNNKRQSSGLKSTKETVSEVSNGKTRGNQVV